jgi:hypothetical protein
MLETQSQGDVTWLLEQPQVGLAARGIVMAVHEHQSCSKSIYNIQDLVVRQPTT